MPSSLLTLELVLGLDPEHLEVLEDGEHDVAHGARPRGDRQQADQVPAQTSRGLGAPSWSGTQHSDQWWLNSIHVWFALGTSKQA